jgi:predicted RNase H-like HicB family nuclease
MTKKYPIILYPVEENGATSYSVLVPDFPGCVSHGNSEQDALENARAALDLHIQALIEDGQTIAEPSTVDQVKDESEPGAIYALVELPLSEVREKALARKSTRINVTVPGQLLNEIDDYCEKSGVARSKLFQQLAERFLTDVGHTSYSEHFETALRKALEAPLQDQSCQWGDWDRYPDYFQEILSNKFKHSSDTAGLRPSMAHWKPTSEHMARFVSYIIVAFSAFENLRRVEELNESGRVPALDKNK